MRRSIEGVEIDWPDGLIGADPSIDDLLIVRKCVQGLLGAGGTLIDVGAHWGGIAVPVAKLTPAKVYAFEPVSWAALEANRIAQGISSEKLVVSKYAVGREKSSDIAIEIAPDNSFDHRVVRPHRSLPNMWGEEKRKIQLHVQTSLGDYFGQVGQDGLLSPAIDLPRPVVLKIDVQGSELEVLRGIGKSLPIDFAFVEIWPYGLLRSGETLDSTISVLSRFASGCHLRNTYSTPLGGAHLPFVKGLPWGYAEKGIYSDFHDLYLSGWR